jgi:hypothetical protein
VTGTNPKLKAAVGKGLSVFKQHTGMIDNIAQWVEFPLKSILRSRSPFQRRLNIRQHPICACCRRSRQVVVPHSHERGEQNLVAYDQAWQPGIEKTIDSGMDNRKLGHAMRMLLCLEQCPMLKVTDSDNVLIHSGSRRTTLKLEWGSVSVSPFME